MATACVYQQLKVNLSVILLSPQPNMRNTELPAMEKDLCMTYW